MPAKLAELEIKFLKSARTRATLSLILAVVFTAPSLTGIILFHLRPWDKIVTLVFPTAHEMLDKYANNKGILKEIIANPKTPREKKLAEDLLSSKEYLVTTLLLLPVASMYLLLWVGFCSGMFLLVHASGTRRWSRIVDKLI